MKANDKNLIDVLTQRVYDDLALKQIEKLLMKGKRLMGVKLSIREVELGIDM